MLLFIYSLFICLDAYSKDIFHHFPKALSDEGLTDEELSIQFTLAWETFLNEGIWLNDWGIQQNPSQMSFSSLRYQLGFLTYSAASTCYKTPAYRQICKNIMSNAIERMIDPIVWARLVDERWGPKSYNRGDCSTPNNPDSTWGAAPTWPDPVKYQNIMYSGHVAQMMVLFEAVTGNNTYSVNGWDFNYNKTKSFHYNTSQLLDGLALQALNPNNSQGGIPCEPFLIFTECNEHQNVALNLYSKAIKTNSYYQAATAKFANYLINDCPKKDYHIFEGWIQGLYQADPQMYPINDQGDGEWGQEHLNCGYNGGNSGFSGIPNSPPRDVWVASMAYLWLDENVIDTYVCNDGMIKMLDDRLWKYSEEYDGWVLMNHVDLGIGFGTSIYTIGAKQCLWFNERGGYNGSKIEDRINGSWNYLINKWGGTVHNSYNITAPLLYTADDDNGFGAPIMDTANMLTAMTLFNDSFRQIHNQKWPTLQVSMELLYVDYPNIMVRSATVLQTGFLQFEVMVVISSNGGKTQETVMIVKLDGENNLNKVIMNGNELPKSQFTVNGNQLVINTQISIDESSLFQVITTNLK